jgi:hypothetical protein
MKLSAKLTRGLFVGAALLAATSQGVAQDQVSVKLTAPNYPGGAPIAWNGVYISPYTGVLTATNQTVVLNCVDFFHTAYLNQTWTANRTWLNSADLSETRFGQPLQAYLQAAWLTTQYPAGLAYDPYTDAERYRTIAIQSAIWNIFASGSPDRVVSDGVYNAYDSGWWINRSLSYWSTVDASKFYVLTPTNAFTTDQYGRTIDNKNSFQEFLVYDPNGPPTTVPEPGTLVLLGTGVASLFAARRRRKNQVD